MGSLTCPAKHRACIGEVQREGGGDEAVRLRRRERVRIEGQIGRMRRGRENEEREGE